MDYMFTESYLERGFLCETEEYFSEYDRDIMSLQMQLLESATDGLFTEASDGKSEGIIASAIRAISKLIQNVIDQIKKIFTGTSLRKGCESEKIELSRDPNALTKYLNGYYKDSAAALKKAASGKMSVEEAKAFIAKKKSGFEDIKSVVISAAGAFGLVGITEKYLKKWKSEAERVMTSIEATNKQAFSAVTGNMKDPKNREEATSNAVSIILGDIRTTPQKGFNALLEIPKLLYQKNYLTNKINAEAEESKTVKGRIKNAARLTRARMANDKAARSIDKEGKNREAYQKGNVAGKTAVQKSSDRVKGALSRNYADMRESASSEFGKLVQGGFDAIYHISERL